MCILCPCDFAQVCLVGPRHVYVILSDVSWCVRWKEYATSSPVREWDIYTSSPRWPVANPEIYQVIKALMARIPRTGGGKMCEAQEREVWYQAVSVLSDVVVSITCVSRVATVV